MGVFCPPSCPTSSIGAPAVSPLQGQHHHLKIASAWAFPFRIPQKLQASSAQSPQKRRQILALHRPNLNVKVRRKVERSVGGASSGRQAGQRAGKTPAAAAQKHHLGGSSLACTHGNADPSSCSCPPQGGAIATLNVTAFHLNLLPDNTRLQEASPEQQERLTNNHSHPYHMGSCHTPLGLLGRGRLPQPSPLDVIL